MGDVFYIPVISYIEFHPYLRLTETIEEHVESQDEMRVQMLSDHLCGR